MWGWHEGLDGADWVWMTLMMGLVWAPILLIVLWFLRDSLGGASPRGGQSDDAAGGLSATETARRAYARGDLSREQYFQVVEDLERTKGDGDGT
jgi:uncharacterized membrane protein